MIFLFVYFNISSDTGDCGDYSARFPGLWEICMNNLITTDTMTEYASMDPPGSVSFLLQLLQFNFKLHFDSGNRIPFGLWNHVA